MLANSHAKSPSFYVYRYYITSTHSRHSVLSTCTQAYPKVFLTCNHFSKASNFRPTLKYPNQAPNKPTRFLGHNKLPLALNFSTCSSNTVLEQYLARIKKVLTGPNLVCKFSSKLLVKSFVFKINRIMRGTWPNISTNCCSMPSPKASLIFFFSSADRSRATDLVSTR